MPVNDTEPTVQDTSPLRRPRRRALTIATAGAAAAIAIVAACTVPGFSSRPSHRPSTTDQAAASAQPSPSGAVSATASGPSGSLSGDSLASCAEAYTMENLAKRAFAFAGVVEHIGTTRDGSIEIPVTFTVTHWYKGGSAGRFTVEMLPPDKDNNTSVDSSAYAVGSRLLVSGEDRWDSHALTHPIAFPCGFTRWDTQADADAWSHTFQR